MKPIIGLVVFMLVAGCCRGGDKPAVDTGDIDLAVWEKRMHVLFPPGTKSGGIRMEAGMDNAVYLKVNIPADAWPGFLGASPVDPADLSDAKRFFLGPDNGWWDPGQREEVPTAQASLPNGSVLNMGVCLDGGDRVDVYLMWHER